MFFETAFNFRLVTRLITGEILLQTVPFARGKFTFEASFLRLSRRFETLRLCSVSVHRSVIIVRRIQ